MLIGSVGTIFIVKVAILNRMVWPGVGVMISKLLGLFSMEYLVRVTSGTLAIASSFKATMRRCFMIPVCLCSSLNEVFEIQTAPLRTQ